MSHKRRDNPPRRITGRIVSWTVATMAVAHDAGKSIINVASSLKHPKFVLFLDWHQVLDRSRTEGTLNDKFPRVSIVYLQWIEEGS